MASQAHSVSNEDDRTSIISSMVSELDSAMFSHTNSLPNTSSSSTSTQVRKRKRTADTTWNHAREPRGGESLRDSNRNPYWYCRYCSNRQASTTSARTHLKNVHSISIDVQPAKVKKARQESLDAIFIKAKEKQFERLEREEEAILQKVVDKKAVEEAIVQLIVKHSLPLKAVEWPALQALLLAVNYTVESVLPASRARLPALIEQSFICTKELIKKRLQNVLSDVNFSCDMWTSPNKKAFLAIIAHFVDEDGVLCKALLALPQLRGSHGGELQATYINQVIDEYEIASKVGYFTGDNHGSNDKLCRFISKHLREKYKIIWSAEQHRIRCQGHIVNIAVQAFLFAENKDDIDEAIRVAEDDESIQVEEQLQKKKKINTSSQWRKIGAMGKLHNIVVFIHSSELLYNEFLDLAGRSIPLDNDTRWNSWFIMLNVALSKRSQLQQFSESHYSQFQKDILNYEDWIDLEQVRQFLQPFWKVTQETQGDLDSIEKTLFTMDILVRHLEKSKVRK